MQGTPPDDDSDLPRLTTSMFLGCCDEFIQHYLRARRKRTTRTDLWAGETPEQAAKNKREKEKRMVGPARSA